MAKRKSKSIPKRRRRVAANTAGAGAGAIPARLIPKKGGGFRVMVAAKHAGALRSKRKKK